MDAYLAALSAQTSHGPRVDVTCVNLTYNVKCQVRNTGLTNLPRFLLESFTLRKPPAYELPVLSHINATFRASTSTLVIANSGGGKSALLQFLSGRATPTSGTVLWNGHAPMYTSKIASLAPQADCHE